MPAPFDEPPCRLDQGEAWLASTLPAPLSPIGTPRNRGARSAGGDAMRRSGKPHPEWSQHGVARTDKHKDSPWRAPRRACLGVARLARADGILRARRRPSIADAGGRRRAASPRPAPAIRGPGRQCGDADRRRSQPGRGVVRVPRRHPARSAALVGLPRPGDLLRGALGGRGRPARGRASGDQPRPPPGLAEQRLRSRLPGADARRRRLPVHLHLRRLARFPAAGPRLGAGAGDTIPARSPRPGRRGCSGPR